MLDWVCEDLGVVRAYGLELVRLVAKRGSFTGVQWVGNGMRL